jgi:hypothetical protein
LAKKAELTAKGVLTDVQRVFELALKAEQFSAALKAQEMLGRHLGMWEGEGRHPDPSTEVSAGSPSDIVLARRLMYFVHQLMVRQNSNGAEPASGLLGIEHSSRH